MKKVMVLLFSVGLILGSGQAFAIHEIIPSETVTPLPGADAIKLNEYVVKYDPYRAWQLWPDRGTLYRGNEPHGALLTTFVNKEAYYAIKNKTAMGDGAIIVQENYSADKKFLNLAVMYKLKGYNPAGGGWFWAQYTPDGKIVASGRPGSCVDCHGKRKDHDFIWGGPMKK